MANIGYGYTKKDILHVATNYAISVGKKSSSDVSFSDCWFYNFMRRCGDLQLSKPQKLEIVRAKEASKETVNKYYDELNTLMTTNLLHDKPENIYNLDETGISMAHSPPKVVCSSASNNPQAVTSPRSQNVTIIGCGNAIGNHLPPYYVFRGKRWNPDFLANTCAGSAGEMSQSGWSNTLVFENFMRNHFSKHVNPASKSSPVLVLFDGHKSHVSLTLTEWAKQKNIIFFVLPPHISHLLQPLDVGCFGPLKVIYSRECQMYLHEHPGTVVNKYVVRELSSKAYLKAMNPSNLTSAFRKSGIYPFKREAITDVQVAPASIYPQNSGADDNSNANPNHVEHESGADIGGNIDENNNGCCDDVFSEESTSKCGTDYLKSISIVHIDLTKKKTTYRPPSVVGNLASESNVQLLGEQNDKKRRKTKSQKSAQLKATQGVKKCLKFTTSPKAGPSGVPTKKSRPVSSVTCVDSDMDSSSDDDDDDDDDDKCCVCQKFTPPQMFDIDYVVFLKWTQCDKCGHWTHLKFCSTVRVIRRGSRFECPHCDETTMV